MLIWLRNPHLLWSRFKYLSGLRDSCLVRINKKPDATYRAVAYGVPEDVWEAFDAAYPEYEIVFTKPDVLAAELRLALIPRNTVLLAFDGAPHPLIQIARRGLNVQVFHASFAPIPILERNAEIARGFVIDTLGNWLKARNPTELLIFLDNFDLTDRSHLMAASKNLLAQTALLPAGEDCLLVPTFARQSPLEIEDPGDADLCAAASNYAPCEQLVFFRGNGAESWAEPETVFDFLLYLQSCKTVVVKDNPLGLLATLVGRDVVVTGRPFWAGFGLTQDLGIFKRRRRLTTEDIVALLVFVLSRYVNEANRLIDPADGWALPNSPTAESSSVPPRHTTTRYPAGAAQLDETV